ncbi:unnamed protein product [Euphydryas editha]|uniref:Gem-associated protein 5 n=1 Tax=Euphydryas editha TaxID=104508 RepID=A0AAU9TXL3_EUPED|nr:unnamed protein product [Euphydryas editha]
MDETIIFPSPNWFQVSGLAVSRDNWLVYGGPTKSLCILQPSDTKQDGVFPENLSFRAHIVCRAHKERIVSVDLSREWPQKKLILTGSADGSVKQWDVDQLDNHGKVKSTHNHVVHETEKEEVVGVGYSSEPYAITVGSFGNIVRWDLNSNIAKNYNFFLKNFKPSCLSCSPHIPLNVAVGTKQGVVFVLDLNNQGKILYKIRGQDDEVVNVSWCPQYQVTLKKSVFEFEKKPLASEKLEKNIPDIIETDVNLNNSAVTKSLPDDSFGENVVQEDDIFDKYKDHEVNEFGHKKFEPKDIIVKVKTEKKNGDYLEDCSKLRETMMKNKNESDPTIAGLVAAFDKARVDSDKKEKENTSESSKDDEDELKDLGDAGTHIHKHLLASIGKYGGVRIWSKTGKLVGSCAVPSSPNKNQKNKRSIPNSNTLLWYKPEVLLIADGKSQLLECNPLHIDSKSKLEYRVVHNYHKRGFYCIATNAPRLQSDDQSDKSKNQSNWKIWTVAQDRNLVCYSMEEKKKIATYNTCGGFIYTLQLCPYDAKRLAMSVGDGAVRVWEAEVSDLDETKYLLGNVMSFWQNVQGKVLTVAWHPTKENLLAFATAESRLGIIDTSKSERIAKNLQPVLSGGIYSLCWGDDFNLYACAGGDMVMYDTALPEQVPKQIIVEFENKKWDLSSAVWTRMGMLCGSNNGAVAILNPITHEVVTATFVYSKMIHSMVWHPLHVSDSNDESKYKNLIAVSSNDKQSTITILEYTDKGDGLKLHTYQTLSGHIEPVCQLAWNPHEEGILLSTSFDKTVRVWNISDGKCIAVFDGHTQATFTACWSPYPNMPTTVMSGGGDCCLRLWKYENYPAEPYLENHKNEAPPKKEKKKKEKKVIKKEVKKEDNIKSKESDNEVDKDTDGQVATSMDSNVKIRAPKKFLLPTVQHQISPCTVYSVRKMAQKYLQCTNGQISDTNEEIEKTSEVNFTKMFGTTKELNEFLDMELDGHLARDRMEAAVMLCAFRGHLDKMVRLASERDALCPFVVSLSPCVSFKFWRNATQLYLAQIDRCVAKFEQKKLCENKQYGGHLYRKVAHQLSIHDIMGAVTTLTNAKHFKEAYVLCKARHMESVAEDILQQWVTECTITGNITLAAICYLAMGDVYKASMILSKSNDQECLTLAAELAKVAGQPTFAHHIEDKKLQMQNETPQNGTEVLKPLPLKVDAMVTDIETNGAENKEK